jgi:hypothetical protein
LTARGCSSVESCASRSSHPRNLFTLLGRRYRMKVSQEATDLCPRDLCEDASGESAAARDRALASDLGLVTCT